MNFDLKANALGLVLKTIGIEPTPEGLLKAFKLEPATVFGIAEMVQREAPGFIAWAQTEAPALVKKIEAFDARIAALETDTRAIKAVLARVDMRCDAMARAHAHSAPEDLRGYVKESLLFTAGAEEVAP